MGPLVCDVIPQKSALLLKIMIEMIRRRETGRKRRRGGRGDKKKKRRSRKRKRKKKTTAMRPPGELQAEGTERVKFLKQTQAGHRWQHAAFANL